MSDRYKVVAIDHKWQEHVLLETSDYEQALLAWERCSKSDKWQNAHIVDTHKEHAQLVEQADALHATAKQLAALRDTFDFDTIPRDNLNKARELILDTLGRVQDKLGR